MDDAHASKIYSPVRDLVGGTAHGTAQAAPRRLADPLEGS